MTPITESEIAAALAGHFYTVTRDGDIVDSKATRPPPPRRIHRRNLTGAKWTDAEQVLLIQLYRAGKTWENLTATLGRNHRLIRFKYRELVAQGVLNPRRTGRRPKA